MELTLATPLETRDGTLSKDAKLLNCYWEQDSQGKRVVIKRPGLSSTGIAIPAGPVQSAGTFGVVCWALVNDTMYDVSGFGTAAIPLNSVTVAGQPMSSLSLLLSTGANVLLFQSASGLWVSTSALTCNKVLAPSYPAACAPGVVFLDGTFYVMTTAGAVQGSGLEDPTSWNALNFVSTDRGIGLPVTLVRHLNYVVAMCDFGIQFFYNAANPAPGSPLSPSGNTLATVGCASARSVQRLNQQTIFISKNQQKGRSVSVLAGLTVTQVSTPAIDRILGLAGNLACTSLAFKAAGHSFYLLTLTNLNLTLCWDMTTGDWSQWSSSPDGVTDNLFGTSYYMKGLGAAASEFFLPVNGGTVLKLDLTSASDNGLPIRMLVRTRILDHDSGKRKFLSGLRLIGDTVAATVAVRYSDDDGGNWSNWRTINMATVLKRIAKLGSFYRRTFEFLHTASTPLRLEAMELPDAASPAQFAPEQE